MSKRAYRLFDMEISLGVKSQHTQVTNSTPGGKDQNERAKCIVSNKM